MGQSTTLNLKYRRIVKTHKSERGVILAVCGNELIGKKFEEKGLVLDLSSDTKFEQSTKSSIIEILIF